MDSSATPLLGFRSVFVSDVHLGTPDCRADYLLDFLRRLRCQTLYLVGDIIDFEALARRSYWPTSHAAVVAEMLEFAARGTRVIYVPGNHDASMRRLAGSTIAGIEVQLCSEHTGVDGRRYLVSHGDQLDDEPVGKRWLTFIGERGHRLLLMLNRGLNSCRQQLRLPYLPLSVLAKSRLSGALRYIRAYEQRAADAAREAGFDGHICGHIHFASIREIDGVRYINDGDWVEHCTALTEDHSGAFELLHWSEHATRIAHAPAEPPLPISAIAGAALSPARLEALRKAA